jgi:hypothetical protein
VILKACGCEDLMSELNDEDLAELRKTFDACDLNGDG